MQQEQQGREQMKFDLLIVGAGPAGLSAAIRFKQVRRFEHSYM
jgi:electron-transferring-flavoprotein dehydrogenase